MCQGVFCKNDLGNIASLGVAMFSQNPDIPYREVNSISPLLETHCTSVTALTNKIKRKVNLLEVFPSHVCYMVYRVLQRNRTNKMYKYIERKIYCHELADMIVGLGKSEICRTGQQPGEKVYVADFSPKAVWV